ncbi:RNA dependent RNA polymerase-domain-containing protein [Mycena vulgaris]|nr:RNA dependent RNA polymerase-domain-containing protein [Mycena vulgaris]
MSSDNLDIPVDAESEDSDWELWSSFDSSKTLVSSSPTTTLDINTMSAATCSLKRKLVAESSDNPSMKRLKPRKGTTMINVFKSAPILGDMAPFIIAGFHSAKDQEIWTQVSGLPSGVLWEIARLVSMGRLTGVALQDLQELKGSNARSAPKTVETILDETAREISIDDAFAAERKSQSPWEELDLEEAALAVNPNAGLGNCPEYLTGYGGKVCFAGRVEIDKDTKTVKVVLDRCTLTSSCRLCRRFGSSQFLRLKIPSKNLYASNNGLKELFQKPFAIWGSVFRSFYAHDGTVFLFRTREIYQNGAIKLLDSKHGGLTLFEFLDQFNPLKLNSSQALCKWSSRFALGLSNSVPGPVINPADVEEIDDIISPAQSNMTDGCGISNLAFNLKLRRDFNLDSTPCAVQIRHAGRKGMLLLWPDSSPDAPPKIAFRTPSQIKINYDDEAKAHPANATVDILRLSRTKSPARISPEVIVNLEHNGVPFNVFVAMQDAYIAQGVDDLIFWAKESGRDKPEHMFKLWSAVEKSEGVYFARRVREAAGEARFRGLGERFEDAQQEDDEEEPEIFDKAIHERSTAWWPDYISGCPSSLAETVMALLDAGFTPQSLPVLRDKLKQIVRSKIKYRSEHFKYEVKQSASAFVVPDFWDALEEDEIHFKSSRREFQTDGGLETDAVIGDVLMTRNPCKVPTDVRKIKAVKHPKLHDLVDVIVCSVKGQRRLLDFLAGGDYDGDTAIVIWDKEIVDAFVNPPEKFSIEPQGVNACFTRDDTTVAKFLADNARKSPEGKAAELQKYLLGSLRDASAVGLYSSFHDNSILTKGYDNHRTVKLAYQFCKILDSPKTGFVLRSETRNADSKLHWHPRGPAWKSRQKKGLNDRQELNENFLERKIDPKNPMVSRPFIMDVLNNAAMAQEDKWLREAEQLFLPWETDKRTIIDPDLTQPWKSFKEFATKQEEEYDFGPSQDLATIARHVEEMYARHGKDIKYQSLKKPSQTSQSNSFTGRPIEVRQDMLRELSRDFAASPSPQQLRTIFDPVLIARLRASYAYVYDNTKKYNGWSRFPWDLALGELCRIKTTALNSHKAVTIKFYERFKIGGDRRG